MKKFVVMSLGLLLVIGCSKEEAVAPEDIQNLAPNTFDLISPADGVELDVYDITFQWENAIDPENDKITYDLYVSQNGEAPIRVAQDLSETSYTLERRSILSSSFDWHVVAKDGFQRTTETRSTIRKFMTRDAQSIQMLNEGAQALFSPRSGYTGVYFNNNFLVMNGLSNEALLGDIWSSSNYGQEWMLEKRLVDTDFERHSHTNVILNDRLYMLGGNRDGQPVGDIYSSSNGIDWIQEPLSNHMTPRYDHSSVVFKNKIYVIGGYNNEMLMDDIMSWTGMSQDSWKLEAQGDQTPFRGIRGHSSLVYDDQIWVMGGTDDTRYLNEVWVSSDGRSWSKGIDLPIMAAYHKTIVYDNKVWLIGGLTESGPSNEVFYYEKDSNKWIRYDMPMEFRALYSHAVITVEEDSRQDGIYILGSFDGTDYFSNLWKLY